MLRVFLILILYLCWFNSAYSLPKCKGSPLRISYFDKSREIYGSPSLERSWNNCFAEITRIEPRTGSIQSKSKGWVYRGSYKNGKAHGLGRWNWLYDTCKVKVGLFDEGDFVEGIWQDCTYLFGQKKVVLKGPEKNCNGKR